MAVSLFALLLAAGTTAEPQTVTPAPVQPPIVVTGDKQAPQQKPVCKLVSTGTMFPKRVCMSKAEWANLESDAEDTMKQMRDWQRVRCNYGSTC